MLLGVISAANFAFHCFWRKYRKLELIPPAMWMPFGNIYYGILLIHAKVFILVQEFVAMMRMFYGRVNDDVFSGRLVTNFDRLQK